MAEIAVVEVNKVQYQHSLEECDAIRKGVAARALADELASAEKEADEIVDLYLRLSPELLKIADAKIREMTESPS